LVLRLSEFSIVGGHIIWVRTTRGKGTEIEARLGTIFDEFFLLLGHTEHSVQWVVGMIFEVLQLLGGSYSSMDLA
jgi:hypothetical protein